MSFISRFIKGKINNAFDRWQSEEMQKRLKIQDEKVAKVQSLLPMAEIFSSGPMATLSTAFTSGATSARAELSNVLGTAFAPLMSDINAFTGTVRNLFEDFYYRQRLHGLVGQTAGQALGFIAGFWLPGGPVIWSQLFGTLGLHVGTFLPEIFYGDTTHPNLPGTPGEIEPYDPHGLSEMPQHVQDIIAESKYQPWINPYEVPTKIVVMERQLVRHMI